MDGLGEGWRDVDLDSKNRPSICTQPLCDVWVQRGDGQAGAGKPVTALSDLSEPFPVL